MPVRRQEFWNRFQLSLSDYFDRNIDTILSQARKQNGGILCANQFLGQMDPKLQEAMLANTSIKFAGGVSAKDARTLAAEVVNTLTIQKMTLTKGQTITVTPRQITVSRCFGNSGVVGFGNISLRPVWNPALWNHGSFFCLD